MQDDSWPIWSISKRARWFYFGSLFVVLAVAVYISWRESSTFLELWSRVSNLTLLSVVVALYVSEVLGGGYKVLASLWEDWWQKRKEKERKQAENEIEQAGAQRVLARTNDHEQPDTTDGDVGNESAVQDDG